MAQWLDRVKFGSGKDGSPAVSGTINSYATCTGTATETSLTTALSAGLGDVILIHQTQGTGAGQWEINYVLADAGSTLTLAYPLAYTYGTGAQAVLVPQYTGGTLSGAVTCTAWNGSTGGIIALMSSGDLTISGSLTGSASGFAGGVLGANSTLAGDQGDSSTGIGTNSNTANGMGGPGGNPGVEGVRSSSGGGGGGYATAGGNGTAGAGGTAAVGGGGTGGTTSLTSLFFGGGGGSGGGQNDVNDNPGDGGTSGGGIIIFAKSLTLSGTIPCNGGNGTASTFDAGGGGGGAGGSVLIKCQTASLGTNLITSSGGIGYIQSAGGGDGGDGGVGRIHIDYFSGYTGTTTPTIDATQDSTLTSQVYYGMI